MSFRRWALLPTGGICLSFDKSRSISRRAGSGGQTKPLLSSLLIRCTPNYRKKEKQAGFTRLLGSQGSQASEGYFLASIEATLMVLEASSKSPFTTTSCAAKDSAFAWSLKMKTFLLAPS